MVMVTRHALHGCPMKDVQKKKIKIKIKIKMNSQKLKFSILVFNDKCFSGSNFLSLPNLESNRYDIDLIEVYSESSTNRSSRIYSRTCWSSPTIHDTVAK
jgi:hypothetical protein